jgi:hypothetical protein
MKSRKRKSLSINSRSRSNKKLRKRSSSLEEGEINTDSQDFNKYNTNIFNNLNNAAVNSAEMELQQSDSISTEIEMPKGESPKRESPKRESPKRESPKKESPKKESVKSVDTLSTLGFDSEPKIVSDPKKENMITIITSHGEIMCDANDAYNQNPIFIEIPEGIEVIKFTISVPGVAAFATEIDSFRYIRLINKYADLLILNNFSDRTLNSMKKGIELMFKNILKREEKKEKYNKEFKNLIYTSNKALKMFKLKPGDKIINKTFIRQHNEKFINDYSILELDHTYNYYDLENELPDLLIKNRDKMTSETRQLYGAFADVISTKEIIEYYKSIGIKKLMIFDFSCSSFIVDGKYSINDRSTRSLRRQVDKNPYGGSKRRK